MYCEEGRDKFTVRQNVLGHMQQVKHFLMQTFYIYCNRAFILSSISFTDGADFDHFGNSGRYSVAFWQEPGN